VVPPLRGRVQRGGHRHDWNRPAFEVEIPDRECPPARDRAGHRGDVLDTESVDRVL